MSRCKACNCILTYMPSKLLPDGQTDDMCRRCVSLSYDITVDHEYEHGRITEDPLRDILEYNEIISNSDY